MKTVTLTESEAQFQAKVVELAQYCGWIVAHFRPAQNGDGDWRTPVAADGKGFPDLVLVHPRGGTLFRELKSEKGQVSNHQARWLDRLSASGADAAVWRPSDWDDVKTTLMSARRATPLTDRITAAATAEPEGGAVNVD